MQYVNNKVRLKCASFVGRPVGNSQKFSYNSSKFLHPALSYILQIVRFNFVENLRVGLETISTSVGDE